MLIRIFLSLVLILMFVHLAYAEEIITYTSNALQTTNTYDLKNPRQVLYVTVPKEVFYNVSTITSIDFKSGHYWGTPSPDNSLQVSLFVGSPRSGYLVWTQTQYIANSACTTNGCTVHVAFTPITVDHIRDYSFVFYSTNTGGSWDIIGSTTVYTTEFERTSLCPYCDIYKAYRNTSDNLPIYFYNQNNVSSLLGFSSLTVYGIASPNSTPTPTPTPTSTPTPTPTPRPEVLLLDNSQSNLYSTPFYYSGTPQEYQRLSSTGVYNSTINSQFVTVEPDWIDISKVRVYARISGTGTLTNMLRYKIYGTNSLNPSTYVSSFGVYNFTSSNSGDYIIDLILPRLFSGYNYLEIMVDEIYYQPPLESNDIEYAFYFGSDIYSSGSLWQNPVRIMWQDMDNQIPYNDMSFQIYGHSSTTPTPTPTGSATPTPTQTPSITYTPEPTVTTIDYGNLPEPDFINPPSNPNIGNGEIGTETNDWKNITSNDNGNGSLNSWSNNSLNNITSGVNNITNLLQNNNVNYTKYRLVSKVLIDAGTLNIIPDEYWILFVLIVLLAIVLMLMGK